MIQHDYLLRLIEQFMRSLAHIQELRVGPESHRAGSALDRELEQILATNRRDVLRLGTTELLARIVRCGAAHEVRTRALFAVTLLKESGDLALEQDDEETGRDSHVQALRLLLEILEQPEHGECPQFSPTVDAIAACLDFSEIPSDTLALLMRHHERRGEFGKAEDVLFALLEAHPSSPEVVEFGKAYYRRLLSLNDASLDAGNLPRNEVIEGLQAMGSRLNC